MDTEGLIAIADALIAITEGLIAIADALIATTEGLTAIAEKSRMTTEQNFSTATMRLRKIHHS